MRALPFDRKLEDYTNLLFYDKHYPPLHVEKPVRGGQTLPGSCSTLDTYTTTLVHLLGFAETPLLSTNPTELIIKKPTDHELWMSLIGIFESGNPHFAEYHDEIYGQLM